MFYAIKHKASGNFVRGTDYNYSPPRQRICTPDDAPLLLSKSVLDSNLKARRIDLKKFEVVPVEIREVAES